uniref:Uncharacterized protein n=1 Tax=Arundo donax TaxID=35708 RepID=A0A0A9DG00_ARUDO
MLVTLQNFTQRSSNSLIRELTGLVGTLNFSESPAVGIRSFLL